jgi:F-type H+-transporting ATPase subunit b
MKTLHRYLLFLFGVLALAAPLVAQEAEEAAPHGGGELPRIVNFAVLAAILVLVLRKPIAAYVNAKTDQIREQLKDAKAKQEKADSELKRAEELLKGLASEVEKAKEEARRAAEAERDRILGTAEQEASRIRELAKKEVSSEVEAGRRKLLAQATELSVDLARKKLEASMTDDDRKKLIDRSIEILASRGAAS